MGSTFSDGSTPPRFVVGIDLGTTNSAAAYYDTKQPGQGIRVFPIVQFVAPGETEARETLPSFHYSPAPGEFGAMRLPWAQRDASEVVGVLARDHGAAVPGRLITSAKSWLSHPAVDRTANLLPWHGAPDVEKLSPLEVSARYLGHIRDAWNYEHPEFPLEQQDVVITIPASFDEIARELTVSAAQRAGLPRIVLLEEPQAAFYAWIYSQGDDWDRAVQPGQRILVCDVGGGTTDLTLIQVRRGEDGEIRFHRFAVGEHLILGGDNLDLALAHFVEQRLTGGRKLEPRQWSILVRRCQQVKEILLGADPPEKYTVSLPSTGARLIGGGLKAEITRDEVNDLLVDGFLPRVRLDEKPSRRASGFQEFGLPYAPDPAITRYLALFLTTHRHTVGSEGMDHDPARPDIVLFNGGFFESAAMRRRLLEVLASWFHEPGAAVQWEPKVLKNERLDLAVAFGAVYYGLVRRGIGVRISGGLARSYYIGVGQTQAGQPQALCLVPAGLEEGEEVFLRERQFDLLIRRPVEFPLYVSSSRTTDQPGDLIPVDTSQISALPPIRTVLRAGKSTAEAEVVPVQLHARLTEIGTLEVWCEEMGGPRRWKLQFDVRSATQTELEAHEGTGERAGFVDEAVVQDCRMWIQRAFGASDAPVPPETLVKRMEEASGMSRLEWPPSLLRSFWEALMQVEEGRKRSVMHEARWLNLLGFSLRPGYGVALDDWRVSQTWRLVEKRVHHAGNEMCRAEWWILWRRLAGGLVPGQQRILSDPLIALLRAKERAEKAGQSSAKTKGTADFRFGQHETAEVYRLLGSLELLSVEVKTELGELILAQIARKGIGTIGGAPLWALGRLGARVLMRAPANLTVPVETVERWIEALLRESGGSEGLWFALMQMARRTDDRFTDISDSVRAAVLTKMSEEEAPGHLIELVRSGGRLRSDEQDLVFGEALPPGLRLK